MKVRNKSYIRKLAKKILNNNPGRKNILLVSIVLACILFTSLFSVAFGIGKSIELQTMKSIGTVSHGSFKELDRKDIEILSKDDEVKDYSVRTKIGIIDDDKIAVEISYVDEKGMAWSIIDNEKGKFPTDINEIYIDRNTVKKLGYKGQIGEKIKIPFFIEKSYTGEVLERKEVEFEISGTFENSIDSNVGVGQIYVSKAYVDSLKLPNKQNDMDLMLKNSWKIKNKLLDIAKRNGYKVVDSPGTLKEKEIRIGVNFAYFSNGEEFNYELFLPVILLLVLVFLAGYLIINNIFQISVNEDIKLFGLLKTIGMTNRQIKKLVHIESLLVAIPSMIIGNILGILIGKIIMDKIFETNAMLAHISLSVNSLLIVILFSVIFTLITVFFSVRKPASQASKTSPIDASRFNEYESNKNYKGTSISLNKLARRQVFSNKFRFVSIVLSMSLSAVILNSVLTYTGSIDLEKGLSNIIVADYNIASPKYFRYMYINSANGFEESYIKEIKEQEGYKGGGAIYSYGTELSYPDIKIQGEKIAPVLFGMDDYLVGKQEFVDGSFDQNNWQTGKFAVIGERSDRKSSYKPGDKLVLNLKGKSTELEVMGKINYNFSNGLRYYNIIHENRYDESSPILELEYVYVLPNLYKEITGDMSIMSYAFDVENSKKKEFDTILKDFERKNDFAFDSRDRQIESFKSYKNLIEFVGYSLASVLFLISVLNFINIIATEIIKNKINFSILESIGLTRKNLKKYLVKKNLIYSLSALVFSLAIMILLNKFVLEAFIKASRWNSFKFVLRPLLIINFINILIGIIFTATFYKKQNKMSLVDRIRNL